MKRNIINLVKPFGRLFKAAQNMWYHFIRYAKYSGYLKIDVESINYDILKTAHALEKSICMPKHKAKSGWENAKILNKLLNHYSYKNNSENDSYIIGVNTLNSFVDFKKNLGEKNTYFNLGNFSSAASIKTGGIELSKKEIQKGKLSNPEVFFFSRHSIRNYDNSVIDKDTINRIISLASKSPSACNRQHWFVYNFNTQNKIQQALNLQSGNRGFNHTIRNLFIICSDISAFVPGQEAYQHWIDGGMFSMSIVYAIHSLGLGSCCLNWSVDPSKDKQIRKVLEIKKSHSIMMMISYGNLNEKTKVCVSPRKPKENYYGNY